MKKYIVARPETIVSIIQLGCFPENLPAYLAGSELTLWDTITQSLGSIQTNLDQTFIIEVNMQRFNLKNKAIATESFEKIICYSEKGNKLLQNLLKQISHPVIEINSAAFSITNTIVQNATNDNAIESPVKKARIMQESSSSAFFQSSLLSTSRHAERSTLIERLSSPSEHIALLNKALERVQKTLLITSYDINHDALQRLNFYTSLERALSRGVKVYIYYNDGKGADRKALKILNNLDNVKCDEAFTHSKFLCVDNQWVSIGSYNWLSFYAETHQHEKKEGTIVCYQRDINAQLNQDIWNHLKFYRHLQFDNHRALRRFDANINNHSTVSYSLASHSEIEYIPTLEQHCAFFQEILKKTKKKLVICSPFLSMLQCTEDIRKRDLRSLSERGVQIFFVTSSANPDYPLLQEYLLKVDSNTIHLVDHAYFHLKTLIIDDKVIAEGSFNWLSATRDEESDFHNHEATLVVRGESATALINDFYQSAIGQKIVNLEAQKSVSNTMASINR